MRWLYPVDMIPHLEAGVCLGLESGFDVDYALCNDTWILNLNV